MELLVVMGLMGALATISTGGYYAVVRGMEERGALSAATSIIRAAQQRARIDRVPTAIYFYNELVQAETSDDYAKVQGVAIAVRMSGRISFVSGDKYFDEFSDLGEIYGISDPENPKNDSNISKNPGMRIYKMADLSNKRLEYTVVGSTVVLGSSVEQHFIGYSQQDSDEEIPMYAFVKKGEEGSATWKTGDAYAFEFATVRLPVGYIFKTDYPTSVSTPVKDIGVEVFDPEETGDSLKVTIDVYSMRPGSSGSMEVKKVGTTSTDTTDV